MKTVAAVLHEIDAPLKLEELTIPVLAPGQVLVEIAFSGVCHTQLHEIRGRKGPDRFLPHALGHEASGRVVAIGPNVSKVQIGDAVVLSWIKGQGADVPSVKYRDAGGNVVNAGAVCTFMRTAVVSENRVCKIPDEMPMREAALLGCAIPTGAGVIFNSLRVRPGESVVIFGAGGIGLAALLAARVAHAHPIAVVDVVSNKLQFATELGATHVIDARDGDVTKRLLEVVPGGFDYAVEAAGRKETMEGAIDAIRAFGGKAVLAGNLAVGDRIAVDPFDLIRGKLVVGTWGGETVPDRDIPTYARMYIAKELPLSELISQVYRLEDINQAITDLEEGRVARALIDMK